MDRADIETPADVEQVVRRFYERALGDDLIGFLFTDVARIDLDEHVPKVAAFWDTILLGTQRYTGGAFHPHATLNAKAPLRQAHFERWLVLWCRTVDELHDGPRAALAKVHALRVANAFHGRLQNGAVDEEEAVMRVTHHGPSPGPTA